MALLKSISYRQFYRIAKFSAVSCFNNYYSTLSKIGIDESLSLREKYKTLKQIIEGISYHLFDQLISFNALISLCIDISKKLEFVCMPKSVYKCVIQYIYTKI